MQIIMNILLKKHKLSFILCLLFCSCYNLSMVGQDKLQEITVTLTTSATSYTLGNPVELVFTVENAYEEDQKVCKYMTPIEGFYGNYMLVTNEAGEELPYKGIRKKRTQPKESSFVPIASGTSLTKQFNLTDAYPITEKGVYTIQFTGSEYLNKLPDSNVLKITIE